MVWVGRVLPLPSLSPLCPGLDLKSGFSFPSFFPKLFSFQFLEEKTVGFFFCKSDLLALVMLAMYMYAPCATLAGRTKF